MLLIGLSKEAALLLELKFDRLVIAVKAVSMIPACLQMCQAATDLHLLVPQSDPGPVLWRHDGPFAHEACVANPLQPCMERSRVCMYVCMYVCICMYV